MMQFIPFPLIASLPIAERLPVFNKWYPDGIRMPPTWLQSRSGDNSADTTSCGSIEGECLLLHSFAYVNLLMLCQYCAG